MSNPCIRCGKPRIDGKSWEGKSGISIIIYTQTICPDPECQKIVDQQTADRKAKSELLAKGKMEAKLARQKLMATASV
ncbi:hypothetical protein HYZ06_00705 [Candidatus Daviesbacteria bacterium]|nr:hypothetical protein [Candidatus Daviesbacteria bacterium]